MQAFLHTIGVPELVVTTKQELVRKAVEIASNPTLQANYRRTILANNHKLFDDQKTVLAWEVFFRKISR